MWSDQLRDIPLQHSEICRGVPFAVVIVVERLDGPRRLRNSDDDDDDDQIKSNQI